MIENLLELIGGRQTIQAATERFYEKVLEDDSLRHFFTSTDMAHLRSRQVMFISMLLGGGVYTGKDVHEAHALANALLGKRDLPRVVEMRTIWAEDAGGGANEPVDEDESLTEGK